MYSCICNRRYEFPRFCSKCHQWTADRRTGPYSEYNWQLIPKQPRELRFPIGLDTETCLIRPGRGAPPVVCVALAHDEQEELWHRTEAREHVVSLLTGDRLIVGHNIAFDMSVICAEWPDLVPLVFEVYQADRITDTSLREQLIDIADGKHHGFERRWDRTVKIGYSLADVASRRLGIEVDKGEDTWRRRYEELYNVPISEWPIEAKNYALFDAVVLPHIYEKQEYQPGYLLDEYRQARAAWWIRLMEIWGIPINIEGVREFAKKTHQKFTSMMEELCAAGLAQRKKDGSYARKAKAAKERMHAVCTDAGRLPEMTPPSKSHPEGQVKVDDDNCQRSGDPLLRKYGEASSLMKTLSTDVPLLLGVPRKKKGDEVDKSYESGRQRMIQDLLHDRPVNVHRIWTHFDSLKNSGRTGSAPNVQNWPTNQGMRECVEAPPGQVFAVADYSGFELRTWAQCCVFEFDEEHEGKIKMAKALNEGRDPHIEVACRILGISYEQAKAEYKQDPRGRVYYARQTGKVCFHPDTEVLTRVGWKKITEVSEQDEVCSAMLADDGDVELEWEKPLRMTSRKFDGELVHMKNEGINLRVTPDHRMCGWKMVGYRDGRKRQYAVTCKPEELGSLRYWPNAGVAPGGVQIDERLLRVAVVVQADGHYPERGRIRLGFTKRRKVERLRSLLRPEEYEFKLVGSHKVSTFYLAHEFGARIKELLTARKTIPWWWTELEPQLRAAVLDEVREWDSNASPKRTGYGFTSTIEENVDVLQAMATITLAKSRKTGYSRPKAEHADVHQLSVKLKHRSRGGNLSVKRIPYNGEVYCLTTRNDTIVVRDGGVPVITRQCNFGLPGGLREHSLVDYARKGYGVILTAYKDPNAYDEKGNKIISAQELIEYWKDTWPESKMWFERLGVMTERSEAQIIQNVSNRIRGGIGFTDGANTLFQGLAADAAKAAGFLIARACYTEPKSPLYGWRIFNFIHDEFMLIGPDDERAHDAAIELARLMKLGAEPFLPDVPAEAEPMLARRWSKAAKPVFDRNGRLKPWDFGVESDAVEAVK